MSANTTLMNERPLVDMFHPPERLLMGAGPSRVHEDVLRVMSQTTIGHLDPDMITMMDQLKDMLRYIFQTSNNMTFPVSGPGSLGMEACANNMIEPGDDVIVAINGVFGTRMAEVARRAGANVTITEDDWGKAVDPNKVEKALKSNPNVNLYSVNVPLKRDNLPETKKLVKQLGYQFPTLYAQAIEDVENLGIYSYPNILIVKDGQVRFSGNFVINKSISFGSLEEEINFLLNEE